MTPYDELMAHIAEIAESLRIIKALLMILIIVLFLRGCKPL